MSVDFHDVIKQGYKTKPDLSKHGFILDEDLSNRNQQTYYNPTEKKLIYNVSGTKNLGDWGVNSYLLAGKLKETARYKDAHKGLREAKAKYGVDGAFLTGDSLGGGISSYIGSKNDKVNTFNKATVLGSKSRRNTTDWRIAGDPVSLINKTRKHSKTLSNRNLITPFSAYNAYNAHLPHNLKNRGIKI